MKNKTTVDSANLVDQTIRERKTLKVLATGPCEVMLDSDEIQRRDQDVLECIEFSGWAPFHYDRKQDDLAEPWRYAVLFHRQCRLLSEEFFDIFTDIKPSNKLPRMLNACGALVLVNWLPEKESESNAGKITQVNEEHLAAASAATQNLMLSLEARGMGTYWSSGGVLGSRDYYDRIGMDPEARLIAAVFVNYPGLYPAENMEIISGKNREKRSSWDKWTKVIG